MVESVKEYFYLKIFIIFCLVTRNYAARYRPFYNFIVGQSHIFPQLSEEIRNQTEYSNNIYFNYYNKWVLSAARSKIILTESEGFLRKIYLRYEYCLQLFVISHNLNSNKLVWLVWFETLGLMELFTSSSSGV